MDTVRVKYAGVVFEVSGFGIGDCGMLERYRTGDPADEMITLAEEDLTKAYIMMNDYKYRAHPNWYVEDKELVFVAAHDRMCPLLLRYDALVFHGASVAVDDRGYLYLAYHNTGKSTHVRYWEEYLGDRAVLVDDDKPIVKIMDDCVYVYGTSWSPNCRAGMVGGVPLRGIVDLQRGMKNEIDSADRQTAFEVLMSHCYRGRNSQELMRVMSLCNRIVERIPFAVMKCTNDVSAATVAYEYLKNV